MDARLRLIVCLGYVLIVVSVPPQRLDLLAGLSVLPLATAILARVPPLVLLRRLLLLAPFVLVAAAAPLLRQGPLDAALGMLAKAGLGCSALVLLAATTPVDRLLAALAALRCPRFLVLQLGLTARYLHLLGEEASRLRRAAVARGFRPRHLLHARIIGDLIGALFLRSVARAERVHAAMLARGFAGELVAPEPRPWCPRQALLATGVLACALAWRLCWN